MPSKKTAAPQKTPHKADVKHAPKPPKKATAIKAEKKSATPAVEAAAVDATAVDQDELEEQNDAQQAAAAGGGGNAAALAAASGSGTEMSASFKNFRHHPDMENFYRFIYENDLRHEALAIIDEIMVEKAQRRAMKNVKMAPH